VLYGQMARGMRLVAEDEGAADVVAAVAAVTSALADEAVGLKSSRSPCRG
jgi:hypothetical protein